MASGIRCSAQTASAAATCAWPCGSVAGESSPSKRYEYERIFQKFVESVEQYMDEPAADDDTEDSHPDQRDCVRNFPAASDYLPDP